MAGDDQPDRGIDPDVDQHDLVEPLRHEWDVLLAIAVGGALGAEARYGLSVLIPHRSSQWPWATLATNIVGSALLGVLMVLITEVLRPRRLLRPFIGVGVLGGFTTFSTFALDAYQLVLAHRPLVAVSYVLASVLACVLAVAVTMQATRAAVVGRPR